MSPPPAGFANKLEYTALSNVAGDSFRLQFFAAKSLLGHAETAAGAIGTTRASEAAGGHARPPILHLRHFNHYVSSTLDSCTKSGGLLPSVPRQVRMPLAACAYLALML
jgi:3-oxoacyl-(acyl-carrier-protein) synthase